MDALLQALMTKMGPSTDIYADVQGRIYFGQSPTDIVFPYLVFSNIPDSPDPVFGGNYENYQIQFSLFSSSESVIEISTMYGHLRSLLDDASLTISGDTLIWMRRISSPDTSSEEIVTPEGTSIVRHWSIDYSITVGE